MSFLSEDIDLFLKTQTEAVFWSGFTCREQSPLLSSSGRKESVGGCQDICRSHQDMLRKVQAVLTGTPQSWVFKQLLPLQASGSPSCPERDTATAGFRTVATRCPNRPGLLLQPRHGLLQQKRLCVRSLRRQTQDIAAEITKNLPDPSARGNN